MKVNYTQLVELTGISYKTIRKRLESGPLESVKNAPGKAPGRAILWESGPALEVIYRGADCGGSGVLDLNAERAREAKERADRLELENAVRRGELLEVAEVGPAFTALLVAFRTKITSLPSKLSAMVDDNDERRRLFVEAKATTDEALTDLANGMTKWGAKSKSA